MPVNPPINAIGPAQYTSASAPTASDSDYTLQSLWYSLEGAIYMLIDNTPGAAVWRLMSVQPFARAWVNFDGSNGNINASFRTTSVTRNSTGNYTVAFSSAFSSGNYVTLITTSGTAPLNAISSQTSSDCIITTAELQGGAAVPVDPSIVSIACFG